MLSEGGEMSKVSPMQRTLAYFREREYPAGIVERHIPRGNKFAIKQDLFGILDLVVITPDSICGVQVCGIDWARHDNKILDSDHAVEWLKTGNPIVLMGWRQLKKKRGGKQKVWTPRIKEYTLDDFEAKAPKREVSLV